MFRSGVFATIGIILGGAPGHAQSVGYTFKVFNGKGFEAQSLVGVNRAGSKLFQVVTDSGEFECLLLQANRKVLISDPKGGYTQCTGLGGNGGVVGYYGTTRNPPYQAFAYLNGAYADVLSSIANSVFGNMINAVSPRGLMAGTYNPIPQQAYSIFLTYGTTYYAVPLPPDTEILQATGVNDSASFVGQAFYITMWGDYTLSLLFGGGAPVEIAYPNAVATFAYNINNKGDVVGYYENADYAPHGFIYHAALSTYSGPVDVPGATSTTLTGINDDGIVSGSAVLAGSTRPVAIIGYPKHPHASLRAPPVRHPPKLHGQ